MTFIYQEECFNCGKQIKDHTKMQVKKCLVTLSLRLKIERMFNKRSKDQTDFNTDLYSSRYKLN